MDTGRRVPVEQALVWAGENRVFYMDFQVDVAPNALESFDDARCARVRELAERHGIPLDCTPGLRGSRPALGERIGAKQCVHGLPRTSLMVVANPGCVPEDER